MACRVSGVGRVAAARIIGFTADDFPKLIAFHKPQIGEVVRETPTSLWGKRDGYEIKVDQDRRGQDDPYKDRNKVVIWQTV